MVSDFNRGLIETFSGKVAEIEISLEVEDCTGEVNITDVMLQGGPIVTIWTGHPSELRWQHDW